LLEHISETNSNLRKVQGFQECTEVHQIAIPKSVGLISVTGFSECKSLTEVLFTNDSYLKRISGFQKCGSLCQIEIPGHVKVISEQTFNSCQSLREVRFSTKSSIREIYGFRDCCSLSNVEIPESIDSICPKTFSGSALRFQMILTPNVNLKVIKSVGLKRKFIVYENTKVLKQHRHEIHLSSLDFSQRHRKMKARMDWK
jgi:hypothetical protein